MAAALRRVGAGSPVLAVQINDAGLFLNWARRPSAGEVAAVAAVWKHASHYVAGAEFLVEPGQRSPFPTPR
jgi:hypothetical protein